MTPALRGIAKNLRRETRFPPASPACEEAPSPVARRKDLLPPPPLRPVVLDNCLRECRIAIGHLLDRKLIGVAWNPCSQRLLERRSLSEYHSIPIAAVSQLELVLRVTVLHDSLELGASHWIGEGELTADLDVPWLGAARC